MTTNCIMPPRPSYADRIYTTSVVGYPGLKHIPEEAAGKDFSPSSTRRRWLWRIQHRPGMSGINGGHILTTGTHKALGDSAPAVIDAIIKSGAVKHIFLVGGCDGAHPGRNYYTDFVKSRLWTR